MDGVQHKQVAAADGGTIEVPVVDIDLYEPEILPNPWDILREMSKGNF